MGKYSELLKKGKGILHLVPAWVPRPFNEPGRRLRLHPDDYYAYGMERGGICERWIGSVAKAKNGEGTTEFEGLSFVLADRKTNERVLLKDVIEDLGAGIIGDELYRKYGTWPTYTKFFDYDKPLFHHLHLMKKDAEMIGELEKPEAYYFPVQYNCSQLGRLPLTYYGFDPSTTKEQVKEAIRNFTIKDNRLTELSRGYRIKIGTGWFTPAGVIHAPASVVTYEPQWNADGNTIMENLTMGEVNAEHFLTDCQPEDQKGDVEALFRQLNWEECTRPDYKEKYYREPKIKENEQENVTEKWVAYANDYVAAKEVSIAPGTTAVITDPACYSIIVTQGHGKIADFKCEAPDLLRFGQNSADEFFVSEPAAKAGVVIENHSDYEPLVFLQHFANNNPEVPTEV